MIQIISIVLTASQIVVIGICGFRSVKEFENKNYEAAIYHLLWMIAGVLVLKS